MSKPNEAHKPLVLIVDDTPENITLMNGLLKDRYHTRIATSGERALRAALAETRDNEAGNHLRRTQNYVRTLARRLQAHPKYAAHLDDATIEMLYKSAPLHDIGKVGIPDAILLKPGKLTPEEFEIMKTHTT